MEYQNGHVSDDAERSNSWPHYA